MPSPPPAPRRGRTAHSQQQQGRNGPGSSTSLRPSQYASNGFDSSDDIGWNNRGQTNDNSASFTFGGDQGQAPVAARAPAAGLFATSRPAAPPDARSRFPDADQLMSSLAGPRAPSKGAKGSKSYHTESEALLSAQLFPTAAISEDPAIPGPSRVRLGPSHARLSNSSSFASSPGPLRRLKAAGGLNALPSTPTGARMAGLNADGSYSVVRDDEDANNSGLLDLGPQNSFGRNGDLFGFRRARGTPAKKFTPPNPASGADAFRVDHPTSRLSDPPLTNPDDSVVEHSLPDVPESDEVDHLMGSSILGGIDGFAADLDDDGAAHLLRSLRLWRQDAMEHHLYDTAIFWGEKVICMEMDESQRCNDAYFLAKAYFLTHQYSRAERLLMTPLPDNTSVRMANLSTETAADDDAQKRLADEDALQAAVNSTRKGSFLPSHLLKRSSAKPSLYAGVFHSPSGQGFPYEDGQQMPSLHRSHSERKRKDREFTVSGTGTGSDSDAAEGPDSDTDKKSQSSQPHRSQDYLRRDDFRRRNGKHRVTDGGGAPSITDAWRDEQVRALNEVQAQHNASITRQNLSAQGSHSEAKPLVDISAVCRFLAAKCMVRLGKFGEALDLVGEESGRWIKGHKAGNKAYSMPSSDGLLKVGSSMSHLRGLIHLRLDDLDSARSAFLDALRLDVKNYDAFAALVDGRLIEANEVWSLIESLQWEAQSNGDRQSFDFIRLCYTARLGKDEQTCAVRAAAARRALWDTYSGASGEQDDDEEHAARATTTSRGGGLYNSLDLLYALAEDLHARRRFSDALIVTRRILDLDPEHEQSLDLHISSIACLSATQAESVRPQLFLLANRLVEEHPESATSWYAVGTWYGLLSRWTDARTYFSKATLLNPRHLASWLSFAHTFSREGESEQAILAYSSVIRNFPDCKYAKVCLGAEHTKTGNLKLARVFLEAAVVHGGKEGDASVEVGDAEVEMGVLCFYEGRYEESISLLKRCLAAFASLDEPDSAHTTTRLNLAWAYRRAGHLTEAREMFHSVIELEPENLAAFIGLGMVDHALGRVADAVGWYHEALCIDPRHTQATELLQAAMDEYAQVPISKILNGAGSRSEYPPEAQPMRLGRGHQEDASGASDMTGESIADV